MMINDQFVLTSYVSFVSHWTYSIVGFFLTFLFPSSARPTSLWSVFGVNAFCVPTLLCIQLIRNSITSNALGLLFIFPRKQSLCVCECLEKYLPLIIYMKITGAIDSHVNFRIYQSGGFYSVRFVNCTRVVWSLFKIFRRKIRAGKKLCKFHPLDEHFAIENKN